MEHKHIITALVENKFGVLTRIAGLFSSRGYNIDSLAVGVTQDPEVSRMTIVVTGDDRIIEQVNKQLNKVIDVIKVQDLTDDAHIEGELVLMKVHCTQKTKPEIIQIVSIFNATVVDFSKKSMTLQIVGSQDKLNAFYDLMKSFGIKDMSRTGRIALPRGD